MKQWRTVVLLMGGLLASCTAGGAEFAPLTAHADKGVVYVYTLDHDMLSPQVVIDGREVGRLEPLGHMSVEMNPGHHSITTTALVLFKQKPVEVDVAAGQSLYLRFDGFRGSILMQMPADIAREEIRTTRQSGAG
jgi:Protein of unknown function (DUF2846)